MERVLKRVTRQRKKRSCVDKYGFVQYSADDDRRRGRCLRVITCDGKYLNRYIHLLANTEQR